MTNFRYGVKEADNGSNIDWGQYEKLHIAIQPWMEYQTDIRSYAKLAYTDSHMLIYMETDEKSPLSRYDQLNDPVCKDSCLEFFFMPFPNEDSRYLNFEINPMGTMHIGIGKDRYDREKIVVNDYKKFFCVGSKITDSGWVVEFKIPFAFLRSKYSIHDGTGHYKANFYKCGDETSSPHYVCWNEVCSEQPDFHLSNYFGDLEFI